MAVARIPREGGKSLQLDPIGLDFIRSHKDDFNSCNHRTYNPYLILHEEKLLRVERRFWRAYLTDSTRAMILREFEAQAFRIEEVDAVATPHEEDLSELAVCIYTSIHYQYDFHQWAGPLAPVLPEHITYLLTKPDMRYLIEKARLFQAGREPSLDDRVPEDEGGPPESLVRTIRDWFTRLGARLFVKSSATSGKNDRKLRPLCTVRDVLEFLTNALNVLTHYERHVRHDDKAAGDQSMALIAMPWNDKLRIEREFRVFVRARRVTAISQGNWFTDYEWTHEWVAAAAEALITHIEAEVAPRMPMPDAVLDIWVDENMQARLIELNPFGIYQSSGSALFHWIPHESRLYGVPDFIPVRYVTQGERAGAL